MDTEQVLFLSGYHYWAMDIILEATDKLNFTCQFGHGPVRARFVWQMIARVLNHGTQHRSEAAYLLAGYGHSPGDLDFNYYVRTRG